MDEGLEPSSLLVVGVDGFDVDRKGLSDGLFKYRLGGVSMFLPSLPPS